ncbi:MAG: sugar transferase [Bacilli bacterium]|nr:sugar transferase [Bacilli bacterium]
MYQKYIKRFFDFTGALILFILFFPIMIITAVIIKLSLGKLTIKETVLREGINQKPFQMYKIRTKIDGTRGKPDNQRYTTLTKIIDIFRINELPQLFNIIKGDMSFVGPRPFLVNDDLSDYVVSKKRYLVKPGITGLAQINGARSISQKQKLEYDIIYYDKISLLLDLKIILLTPVAVIKEYINYLTQ